MVHLITACGSLISMAMHSELSTGIFLCLNTQLSTQRNSRMMKIIRVGFGIRKEMPMAKNTLTTAFYQTEKNLKHPVPVRAYKDRIFRMIFKEKRALLALYNAMNDTAYQDPEELVITTLENAIYLGMKNDVSFMICDRLFLYEHQSTKNPNMPLRNLLYVADLYSVLTKDMFLYGELPVAIPEPRFVVFYNGEQKMEERAILRLSDLYRPRTEHPYLELETLVLNINKGYNAELMEKCRELHTIPRLLHWSVKTEKRYEPQTTQSMRQLMNVFIRISWQISCAGPSGGCENEYL